VENADLLKESLRAEADVSCVGPGKSRSDEQLPRYETWVVSPFFPQQTLPGTAASLWPAFLEFPLLNTMQVARTRQAVFQSLSFSVPGSRFIGDFLVSKRERSWQSAMPGKGIVYS
jgi:hypothetical protein